MPGSPVIRVIPAVRTAPTARAALAGVPGSPASSATPPSPPSPLCASGRRAVRRCDLPQPPPAARRSLSAALWEAGESGGPAPAAAHRTDGAFPAAALRRQVARVTQAMDALGRQVASRPMRTGQLAHLFTRLADAHGPALAEALADLDRTKPWPAASREAWAADTRQARQWLEGLHELRDLLGLLDPAPRVGSPPRLQPDLRAQYAQESRAMVAELLEAGSARDTEEALTYIALMTPETRAWLGGPLPQAELRAVEARRARHGTAGLDADRLLFMRLLAHPHSGAFNAMRALFLLAQAHPGLGLHRTVGGLGEHYTGTVLALAGLPGTRVAGELFKGVVLRGGGPWVDAPPPRPGEASPPFQVLWPMSATVDPGQAYLAAHCRHRVGYDGLLRLRGGVAAVNARWFHPVSTLAQAEALVLPGQWLRVVTRMQVPPTGPTHPGYLLMVVEPGPPGPGTAQAASL